MTMTVPQHTTPIVDDGENPFYCPSIPATSFLESLRHKISAEARLQHHERRVNVSAFNEDETYPWASFSKLLDQSISEDDILELVYRCPTLVNPSPEADSSLDSIRSVPPHLRNRSDRLELHAPSLISETFSDLQGPARRERSIMDVNEGSFELSGKADRIQYFPVNVKFSSGFRDHQNGPAASTSCLNLHLNALKDKIASLEDDLYGPPIGTESPRGIRSLVSRLDRMLPGIRLKEKLTALEATDHQRIVDILAADGYLDSRILNVFRQSEIESLDLTASCIDQEGLNLGAEDLLQVLRKPYSFLFLSELSLSGVGLTDSDIINIHHLPRLAHLWLGNTGIGDEAIYLLTALKRSLTDLDVAYNERISDDAILALLVMDKLQYLSLLDTSITIKGVRRLALELDELNRFIEVEVPRPCEQYINKLSQKYLVDPAAHLITDPLAVDLLSLTALKDNLAAHAEINADISLKGSKTDLTERLKALLEMRKADLLAQKLIWQLDE